MNPFRELGAGIGAAYSNPKVWALATMTAILIAIASVFYHWMEGWGWLDSVYFSVITIATVGYGDFSPQTAPGKLFTIFYVFCGLGLFVATATAIADSIISRSDEASEDPAGAMRSEQHRSRRRMRRRAARNNAPRPK